MKTLFTILAVSIFFFTSCTSAYKTGQTPDDVYYSPDRPQQEYVTTEQRDESRYDYADEYYEERLLRMKVRNRYRWSDLDDWYYYNNRYSYYGNYSYWNNPWNSYTYWNYYYNPYCPKTIVVNPRANAYNKPRTFNLNAYNPPSSNTNPKINGINNNKNRNISSGTNTSRNSGSTLRDIFRGSDNSNNRSSGNSGTTTKSSSSGSSSSGSSSGSTPSKGNAPARKF